MAALLFAFIFLVERPFREKTNLTRSTTVFPSFDASRAEQIEVRLPNAILRADRAHSGWFLSKPFPYAAAGEPIQSLLLALKELNWQVHISAGELNDRPKAQEEFGFITPLASILVRQGAATLHLQIGTNTPVGAQVYVQILGSPDVYVVDSGFLKWLPRSANDWRDRTLLSGAGPVDSIKARSGNLGFSLLNTNGSWRMTTPHQTRADIPKVEDLLNKTLSLQVAAFETDNPAADLEAFGLHTPELEIQLSSGTNPPTVLAIGQSPTNDPSVAFARVQNQNHIFRVAKDPLSGWRGSGTNLIDHRLANFSPDRVAQIEVRSSAPFVLKREGAAWIIPDQPGVAVDAELVGDVLAGLSRAVVEIEKEVVTDFAPFGLVAPALEYALKSNGGPSNSFIAQLAFGTNLAGKVFVRRLDEYSDRVNSIPPEEFHRLPQESWQFRARRIFTFSSNEVVSVAVHQKGKDRKFIRNPAGVWSFAPGSQGIINPFAFDEALLRLGTLKAAFWVAPDVKDPERFGIKEADHRITIEVKRGGEMLNYVVDLGAFTEFKTRYAAFNLHGARTIFEFPWPLFVEVQDCLTIPER